MGLKKTTYKRIAPDTVSNMIFELALVKADAPIRRNC